MRAAAADIGSTYAAAIASSVIAASCVVFRVRSSAATSGGSVGARAAWRGGRELAGTATITVCPACSGLPCTRSELSGSDRKRT